MPMFDFYCAECDEYFEDVSFQREGGGIQPVEHSCGLAAVQVWLTAPGLQSDELPKDHDPRQAPGKWVKKNGKRYWVSDIQTKSQRDRWLKETNRRAETPREWEDRVQPILERKRRGERESILPSADAIRAKFEEKAIKSMNKEIPMVAPDAAAMERVSREAKKAEPTKRRRKIV